MDNILDQYKNYGVGTSVVVNQLVMLLTDIRNTKDTICINVDTILRNCKEKDIRIKDWVTTAIRDIVNIAGDIGETMSFSEKPYVLLFYHVDYSTIIPKHLWRNKTASRELFGTASMLLASELKKIRIENSNYIDIKGSHSVVTSLANAIKRIVNRRDIYLISHNPIDYHILSIFKRAELIESFSGKVVSKKELGVKVFKINTIPFNADTHAILGDKDQFKSSLGIVDKRRLIQLSIDEVWRLRTNTQISTSLKRHNFTVPFKLV